MKIESPFEICLVIAVVSSFVLESYLNSPINVGLHCGRSCWVRKMDIESRCTRIWTVVGGSHEVVISRVAWPSSGHIVPVIAGFVPEKQLGCQWARPNFGSELSVIWLPRFDLLRAPDDVRPVFEFRVLCQRVKLADVADPEHKLILHDPVIVRLT